MSVIGGFCGLFVLLIIVGILAGPGPKTDKTASAMSPSPEKKATTATPVPVKTKAATPAPTKKATPTPTPKPTPTPVKTLEVTAEVLAKAFDDNEIKANSLYKDKSAIIAGTVSDISEMFGQTYIVFKSYKDFSICSVQCFFDDKNEISKIANINKGDRITVNGNIEGKSLNVAVRNCKIVK
jgi:hypothetical protein